MLSGFQVFYGDYYVGKISQSGGRWSARRHDLPLGDFAEVEDPRLAVAEWYYGPDLG